MPRITKPETEIRGCQRVIELATQYKPKDHHREMGYDGLLFGFLDARFGALKRKLSIVAVRLCLTAAKSDPTMLLTIPGSIGRAWFVDIESTQNDELVGL